MNPQPDQWRDEHFPGWPPMMGIHLPSPLPPEFRRENEDLRIPRDDDQLARLENFLIFRPFF